MSTCNVESCVFCLTEPKPYLLFSNRYQLRTVGVDGSNYTTLQVNVTNAVALDYDWEERMIYWSDVTLQNSKISRANITHGTTEVSLYPHHLKSHTMLYTKCILSLFLLFPFFMPPLRSSRRHYVFGLSVCTYVRPVLVITLSEEPIDEFLPNFGHVCILQSR